MHCMMLKHSNVEPSQSCAARLIFVHGLSPLISLGLLHFDFCFISTEYGFFSLTALISNTCFVFGVSVEIAGN